MTQFIKKCLRLKKFNILPRFPDAGILWVSLWNCAAVNVSDRMQFQMCV